MNKICLILPYFGNLPSMFPFFLQSCCFNNHIDFLIFTNPSNKESLCLSNDNIRLFYIEWSDFVKKIQSKFSMATKAMRESNSKLIFDVEFE